MVIIIFLKPDSMVDQEKGSGYMSGGSTHINIRIQIIVIMISKLNSRVNPMKDQDYGLEELELTQVK
jgi:hypothetical protein